MFCNVLNINDNDFDSAKEGIVFETVQYGFNIKNNIIIMSKADSLVGIRGKGLSTTIETIINIEGNGIIGQADVHDCTGIEINESSNQNQDHVRIHGNVIKRMGDQSPTPFPQRYDILINNGGHISVTENYCMSDDARVRNSIFIDTPIHAPVFVLRNHCVSTIGLFDGDDALDGKIIVCDNVTSDTTTSGNVGIGMGQASPSQQLHIRKDKNNGGLNGAGILIENTNNDAPSAGDASIVLRDGQLTPQEWSMALDRDVGSKFRIAPQKDTSSNSTGLTIDTFGQVGIGTTSPVHPLHMASGAHVTAGGAWTDACSRELKKDIQELSAAVALSALSDLKPVTYQYKNGDEEKHVGFVAEDVPEVVARNDRKGLSAMDVVAVLTKVAKEQQQKLQEHEAQLADVDDLEARLARLEALLKAQ